MILIQELGIISRDTAYVLAKETVFDEAKETTVIPTTKVEIPE